MFKHTDGNNTVKLQMQITVILQQDLDVQPGTALLCQLLLLGRNGYAHHRNAIVFRRIGRKPAPATANIQQIHTRLQLQLFANHP
ncbi:hypothetical protein D3C72_2171370 [compost metagenome]